MRIVPADSATGTLCTAVLRNGEEISLSVLLTDPQCAEYAAEGYEYEHIETDGTYCVLNLLSHDGQWGRCIVWDPTVNQVIHLSSTPFAYCAAVCGDEVFTLLVVSYWGKPAQAAYSRAPLRYCNVTSDQDIVWLDMPVPDDYPEPGVLSIRPGPDGVICAVGDARELIPLP